MLQKKFHNSSGREVVSPILNHSYWGVIGSGLFSLVIFIESMMNKQVGVNIFGLELKETIYCICIFYFNVIIWCWVVYCLMVKKAAEVLKEHITQVKTNYDIIILTPRRYRAN